MAIETKRFSLAELMAVIAIVACAFGAWRRFGMDWDADERTLAACWLAAWVAGVIGGRSLIGHAVVPAGMLCASAGAGFMYWNKFPSKAVAVVAMTCGVLALLTASMPWWTNLIAQRLIQPSTRSRTLKFAAAAIALTLVSAGLLVEIRFLIHQGDAREFHELWQQSGYSQYSDYGNGRRSRQPLGCSRDGRYLAAGFYSTVCVLDTGDSSVQKMAFADCYFRDLSPSGRSLLMTNSQDQCVVVNRLEGRRIGSFGYAGMWPGPRFIDETIVGISNRGRRTELWDVSVNPARKLAYVNESDCAVPDPPPIKNAWLRALRAEPWNESFYYLRSIPNSSRQAVGQIVGMCGDGRTVIFCEYQEVVGPASETWEWLRDIPFVRSRAGHVLRINLAALDIQSPNSVRRTSPVTMDYVFDRWESTVLESRFSPDRRTVIVRDGHCNLALWRVADLRPPR